MIFHALAVKRTKFLFYMFGISKISSNFVCFLMNDLKDKI